MELLCVLIKVSVRVNRDYIVCGVSAVDDWGSTIPTWIFYILYIACSN